MKTVKAISIKQPCPFCRSTDLKTDHTVMTGESIRAQPYAWWVKCLNCETMGPPGHTEQEAVERWDDRPHASRQIQLWETTDELREDRTNR